MAAVLLRWAITPLVGTGAPYLLLFPVVTLAGWFGGFGPGFVSTMTGAVGAYLLLLDSPAHESPHQQVYSITVFILAGSFISHLCQLLHREWSRANAEALRLGREMQQRERAERELRDSEQRHRAILDNVGAVVVVKDLAGRYLSVNRFTEQALRRPREAIVGKTDQELIDPDVAAAMVALDRRVLELGHPVTAEEQIPLNGELRTFLTVKFPLRDSAGRIYAISGVATDITDRKRQEELLKRSENELRLIANAVPALISYIDSGCRYRWVNDTYSRWFELPADAVTGRHVRQVLGEAVWQRVEPYMTRALAGETVDFELELPYQTVRPKWVHVTYTPDRGEGGEVRGFVVLVTDIGPAKQAEEELRQAKAAAERASQAKDHFLAALSHELRTPLSPVLMAATELQRDAHLPSAARQAAEMIRRNAELEARLIDDLLDLTRLTRGTLALNRQTVDIAQVVQRTIEVCAPDLHARDIKLKVEAESGRLLVRGDPARLQQILWNLLKNAIKFSSPGGEIAIVCQRDPESVSVDVIDQGIGMEADLLRRVFDAFEQGGEQITRQFGGLGLGLAISRALAELHGGQLEAHSAGRGRGSRFRLRVPAAAPAPARGDGGVDGARASGRRILLVEDHPDTARLMARLLRVRGHQVTTAASVAAAKELLARDAFDLLVSDVGLPDGSGLELMRHVAATGRRLRGIALSGYGMEDDVRRSREAGFSEHLVKPVDLDLLSRTIDRLIPETVQS